VSLDTRLLRESWALASPVADKVAAQFYGMLFSRHPQVRQLFPAAMDAQRDRLLGALTKVIVNIDDLDSVAAHLAELGRDHRKYGVRPEHFPIVGRCLLAALRANLVDTWKPAYDEVWGAAFDLVAQIMIDAAEADSGKAPPYWTAVVVDHQQPTLDLAVVTVEPTQPYPFRAGQYATVQTARWPRVWRPYSIANAPRADNRLTFHVRVVPAGWVSTALAHHLRVGDQILLGAARGKLVLPTTPPRHLVCAAGGTGLAPLKAIVEDTIGADTLPNITLIHGARQQDDLYDLAGLERLAASHGRLQVITAVSDDPFHRPSETTADVVAHLDMSSEPDIYLCGPDEMIRATCRRLSRLDVPLRRIHYEADSAQKAPARAGT
jgi:ferredoxin-NADP reductase/hemoglobin-like flavoprotein